MVFVRERATLFFQKQNFNKKKYIYLSFFNAKFLQLQLNVQKLQLQQSFVAVSTCFTVTLQTVVNIAEGPLHDIRQHGLYFEEVFFFFNKTYCISGSRVVYYVSITQGQTRSSSFRTCAVSAFTAHRLISLMQSKHVINGPSQPPLFVVRQTLKSNVSTMGGKKICWHGRSADVGYFSHAENSFILPLFLFLFFWLMKRTILLFKLNAFVNSNVAPYRSFLLFNIMLVFHGVKQ